MKGVRVAGNVEGQLGNCVLWLFTHTDGVWYVAGPIETFHDKSFERHSGPLGIKGQKGKKFSLRIVAVEETRSDEIANMKPNPDGDVKFSSRPGPLMAQRQVKRT
jgi:hypothetical protein